MISDVTAPDAGTESFPARGPDERQETAHRTAAARWLISVIHAYQLMRSGRPTGCRFLPTCSEYAVVAIDRHGVFRGSGLAAKRLCRCNPWGGHGIDPVPDRRIS
jgi:putative membrane protein insertion efficiency factor